MSFFKCNLVLQISLENEDFPRAIEDIAECLSKRIQALPGDSRYFPELLVILVFV